MGKHIGLFFLVVGLLIVFVFAASFQVGSPEFSLCLIGIASFMLGAFLVYKYRRKSVESERFRLVGKMRHKNKKGD